LDNVSGTEQVTPVIPSTAASLLLVTSRNHLAALVTHVEVRQIVLDVLDDGEAVALLAKVLGAGRSGREPAATARLGALCGRMPLALRIAAAKLVTQPTRSIGAFVDELDRGDRLAQLGVEDGTRSVEAVFVSAYRTLSRPAQRLLRRLGLHPGPHLAGELVAALSAAPLAATEPALAELVAAHLVAQPEPGRYRLHDLIRLFARRLAHTEESAADRTEVLERLVDWYLRCADAANRILDGSQDRIAAVLRHAPPEVPFPPVRERVLAFLEAERENLAVVVAYAAEHGQPAAACQLTYLLSGFFGARGNWSERIDMCRHAVGAARRLGDPRVEAEMHRALGVAYRATYQLGPALDSHLRALPLLRAIGDEQGLAYLYNNIGGANVELRRFERAVTAYRLSLRLHTRTGNTFGAVIARRNLGYAYIRMGLVERSVEELEQALAASRAIGYRTLEAGTLDSLGEAHLRQERYDEAAACFRDALAVSRDNGDLRYEMDSLANLGLTDLSRGAFDDAAHTLEQALALSRRIGHRHAEARILNLLGEVRLRLGDLTAADRHLTASAELRAAVPDDVEEARLHRNLADLADLAARPETARRHREREAGAAAPQRAHPDGMVTVAVGVTTAPVDAATILT
jgi:tetratricopeptide (TPR) repeat protein